VVLEYALPYKISQNLNGHLWYFAWLRVNRLMIIVLTDDYRHSRPRPNQVPDGEDRPLGPYLSNADRKYWDDLYRNGPQAYYDKYGNPLPGMYFSTTPRHINYLRELTNILKIMLIKNKSKEKNVFIFMKYLLKTSLKYIENYATTLSPKG
jgi:hypothetical protein